MLRITGIVDAVPGTLQVDQYVPASFKTYTGALPSPILWRTGNFSSSLLEVRIERNTAALRGVTLTSYLGPISAGLPAGFAAVRQDQGLPQVDIASFQTERHDETAEFAVHVHNGLLAVLLDPHARVSRWLVSGRLLVFDAEGTIVGFGFASLSSEELAVIRSFQDGPRA